MSAASSRRPGAASQTAARADAPHERKTTAFLALHRITKTFAGVKALDDVSLDIDEGEFVCFLGPSGCGKTTLLRIIAGLEQPDAADIRLNGVNLLDIPARSRNFGIVFQSYSLFPNMSVSRNIAYGLECRKWPRGEIPERIAAMLALVNLGDHSNKFPHQLSGGQQQRIAIARARLSTNHPSTCNYECCQSFGANILPVPLLPKIKPITALVSSRLHAGKCIGQRRIL